MELLTETTSNEQINYYVKILYSVKDTLSLTGIEKAYSSTVFEEYLTNIGEKGLEAIYNLEKEKDKEFNGNAQKINAFLREYFIMKLLEAHHIRYDVIEGDLDFSDLTPTFDNEYQKTRVIVVKGSINCNESDYNGFFKTFYAVNGFTLKK